MRYLKQILTEQHITQKELSRRTGIARETINRYCNGYNPKKLETYFALAQGIGIDAGKLIEGMRNSEGEEDVK